MTRSATALHSRARAPQSAPPPLAQLTFYSDTILVTKYTPGGKTTHPVHPADVASAFTTVSLTTGFLPPHTLGYARTGGKIAMAILLPAAKHTLQVETANGLASLAVPLPPLVFVGKGTHYSVFALKEAMPVSTAPLFHAPCPNVYGNGSICQGNTPFPDTAPDTIYAAFRAFLLNSAFNTHLAAKRVQGTHAGNVVTLWHDLHTRKRRRFPVKHLLPASLTLGTLIHQLGHPPV